MMLDSIDALEAQLPQCARLALATVAHLPLHALLTVVDLHATQSSATVREAEQLGVPSVVLSELGAGFFATSIAAGNAAFVSAEGASAPVADRVVALAVARHRHEGRAGLAREQIEAAGATLIGRLARSRQDAAGAGAGGVDHV